MYILISFRIIKMDIQLSIGKVFLLQIYAPTEDVSSMDKDQFCDNLQRAVEEQDDSDSWELKCKN